MPKTFVIAEAGSNHDNSLLKAHGLIKVAKECGADAVKFQFWSSAARMARRRNAPEYLSTYERYAIPEEWLQTLAGYCNQAGIEFMCSTYLPEDVATVAPFVKTMKIASFEANDPELLVAHIRPLRAGKWIMISMGMGARFAPVRDWLLRSSEGNTVGDRVRFLHCVSAYPVPVDQMNLGVLRNEPTTARWQRGDMWFHGLSDHAPGDHTWTGALAVAAGAGFIERHFRLDETDTDNPDYEHAMNPLAFDSYVRHIRYAEAAVGSGDEHAQPAEAAMRAYRVLPHEEEAK